MEKSSEVRENKKTAAQKIAYKKPIFKKFKLIKKIGSSAVFL